MSDDDGGFFFDLFAEPEPQPQPASSVPVAPPLLGPDGAAFVVPAHLAKMIVILGRTSGMARMEIQKGVGSEMYTAATSAMSLHKGRNHACSVQTRMKTRMKGWREEDVIAIIV